jgi:hypothetical protein
MLACHVDPDAAEMISEQFLAGRISPERLCGHGWGWLFNSGLNGCYRPKAVITR